MYVFAVYVFVIQGMCLSFSICICYLGHVLVIHGLRLICSVHMFVIQGMCLR